MLFGEIKALQDSKTKLIKAIQTRHIAHAQLFWGIEGSAALPMAMAYATYLLCENKQPNDSCGKCPACLKSQKLIHPDWHFIFPTATTKKISSKPTSQDFMVEWRAFLQKNPYASLSHWLAHIEAEDKQGNISVEESRNILSKLSLKAFESPYKIMMIWLPELMNLNAANAILKILEEPTPQTVFLLVSHDKRKLLTTIISRLQAVRIPQFSDKELAEILVEKYQIEVEKAQSVAFLADGNLNEALHLLEEVSINHFDLFRNWMRSCFKKDYKNLLQHTEQFSALSKDAQKSFLLYGLHISRETILWVEGASPLVRLRGQELEFVKNFSSFFPLHTAQTFSEKLNEAYYHLERNANAKIVFLDTSLQLTRCF
ncbi:MAG: DNA polymerase III subunit delta [Cytophagales bacterium]|nr:MAG: DNA polymerase III subunit delta [Cytophagales bacterium]